MGCSANYLVTEINRTHPNGAIECETVYQVRDSLSYPLKKICYNATGSINSERSYKDSLLDGDLIWYFQDGSTYTRGFKHGILGGKTNYTYPLGRLKFYKYYENGKANGDAKVFYEDGKIHKFFSYKDDKIHGKYLEYFPNGQLMLHLYKVDGILNNNYRSYFKNGQIKESGLYENGYKIEIWSGYSEKGNLISREYFNQEQPYHESYEYYQDTENLRKNGYYSGDQRIGYWYEYYEDGSLKEITIYDSVITDNPYGNVTIYWNNSDKIKGKGYRKNDLADSLWIFYDQNGDIEKEQNFFNGLPNGLCRIYDSTGSLKTQGLYKDGEQFRTWSIFDAQGKVVEQVKYKATSDYKFNERRSYYPSGAIRTKGFYSSDHQVEKSYRYYEDGSIKSSYDNATDYVVSYYPDGQIEKEEFVYKINMGEFHWGISKEYYIDGSLKSLINYNPIGHIIPKKIQIDYYENCNIKQRETNNKCTKYFENGNLCEITHYKNKKKNGLWLKYNELTGNLVRKGCYLNDKIIGELFMYNDNGYLLRMSNYKNGKCVISTTYFRNGNKKSEHNYKDSQLDGDTIKYFVNGKIYSHAFYEMGEKAGIWLEYDRKGNIVKTTNHSLDN